MSQPALGRGRRGFAFEPLEDRRMLALEVREFADVGNSINAARALFGDDVFDVRGAISANDVDYYRVVSPAGGRIELQIEAAAHVYDLKPTLRALTTSAGYRWYTTFGLEAYVEIDLDPPNHTAPHMPKPWEYLEGAGLIAHESDIAILGATAGATVRGEIRREAENPLRLEFSLAASTYGTVEHTDYPFPHRYMSMALASTIQGDIAFASNYTGETLTSITPENPLGVSIGDSAYYDRSFPLFADLDLEESASQEHFWEFRPDPFAPHVAVYRADGSQVATSDTGYLDVLTDVGGDYFVAVSRSGLFAPTDNETRTYRRPYTLLVTTQADVVVENVSASPETSEILIEYSYLGNDSATPTIAAYWAEFASGAGQLLEIASWQVGRGPGLKVLGLHELGAAPAWARYVVAIADRSNLVTEFDEENNRASVLTVEKPTVEVMIGGGSTPNDGPSYLKEPYAAWVRITNNSLIPHTFHASIEANYEGANLVGHEDPGRGGLGKPDGFYAALPMGSYGFSADDVPKSSPKTITLGPLQRSAYLQVAHGQSSWQWLPLPVERAFPDQLTMVTGGATQLSTLYDWAIGVHEQLAKWSGENLDEVLAKAFKGSAAAFSRLSDLYEIYQTLTAPIPQFPGLVFRLVPTVLRDSAPMDGIPSEFETVEAPPDRKAQYQFSLVSLASANVLASEALTSKRLRDLPAYYAGFLATAELAYDQYRRAQDPPDFNFTTRVVPSASLPPELEGLEDERTADYFRAQWNVSAHVDAAGRAQDKADGASLAGDAQWHAEQLLDASTFDYLAARESTRLIGLATLLERHLAADREDPVAAIERLQTEGPPPEMIAALEAAGWTAAEVDELIGSLTPGALESTTSLAETARLNAMNSVVSSRATLRQALDVRRSAGAAVHEVAPADAERIARLRAQVGERLASGASAMETLGLAQSYVERVREAMIATNAWEQLEGDLDFGLSALAALQFGLDASGDALAEAIDAAELAGASLADIEWLRGQAAAVVAAATTADWPLMATLVEETAALLVDRWDAGIPAPAAYRILGQLLTIRNAALQGDPVSVWTPVGHADEFRMLGGQEVALAPVSPFAGEGTVHLPVDARQGSVEIGEMGGEVRVRYVAEPAGLGLAQVVYVALDPQDWQFQTTFAYGEILAPLALGDGVNAAELAPGQTARYGVVAQFGDTLTLSALDSEGDAWVRVISAQTGEELASAWLEETLTWFEAPLRFTFPSDGTFVVEVRPAAGEPVAFQLAATRASGEVQFIAAGEGVTTTLAAGEQAIYALTRETLTAQSFLYYDALSSADQFWQASVQILGPAGVLHESAAAFDSEPLWIDRSGNYLIVVRNAGSDARTVGFRVLTEEIAAPAAPGQEYEVSVEDVYATALFLVSAASNGIVFDDLGSTAGEGSWSFSTPPNLSGGDALGADGLALLGGAGFAVLAATSYGAAPVQIHFALREAGEFAVSAEVGPVIEREYAAESITALEFELAAGDVVMIDSLSIDELPLALYLERPSGVIEFVGSLADDSDPLVVAESGTHRLLVVNRGDAAVAALRMLNLSQATRLELTAPPTLGSFATGEETHVYRLTSPIDAPVEILATGFGDASGLVTLHTADTLYLDLFYWWEAKSDVVVLDADGGQEYFLVISSYSGAGAYALSAFGPRPGPPADFTGDGMVDQLDLGNWESGYGSRNAAPIDGDADRDGDVDGRDFLVWQRQWSETGGIAVDVAAARAALSAVDAGEELEPPPRSATPAPDLLPQGAALVVSLSSGLAARQASRPGVAIQPASDVAAAGVAATPSNGPRGARERYFELLSAASCVPRVAGAQGALEWLDGAARDAHDRPFDAEFEAMARGFDLAATADLREIPIFRSL